MSSAGPYTQAAQRGCAQVLLQIVLTAVAIGFVFGVPLVLVAVLPLEPPVRAAVGLGSMLCCLGVFVVLALVFAMSRTTALDAGFAPLGIAGRSFIPNLREYHGEVRGRPLDATYARRGGVLDVALACRTGTKVAIGRGSVARTARELFGLSTLPAASDPALAELVVAADDPAWAARLLSDPAARDALVRLHHDPQNREIRWVLVRPDVVRITRRWIDPGVAAPGIAAEVAALAQLADACERQAPPGKLAVAGALESSFRRQPTLAAFALVFGILFVLLVPAGCLVAALLVLVAR